MQGAIVQGLSNTMFEEFVYDENGQQLTADFETYKLATAADVPDIKVTHAPTPCPYTPLGEPRHRRGPAFGRAGHALQRRLRRARPLRHRDHRAPAQARFALAHDPGGTRRRGLLMPAPPAVLHR